MFTCTEPKMKKKYYDEISSILIVKKNVENFSWNFLPWNSLISKGVLVLINANQNPAFIFKTREFQGKIQTLMDGKKSDFFYNFIATSTDNLFRLPSGMKNSSLSA